MKTSTRLLFVCCFGVIAAATAIDWRKVPDYSFDEFVADHRRSYEVGSPEYLKRQELFEAHKKIVLAHNTLSSSTYKRTINKFSDHTPEEKSRYFGGIRGASAAVQPDSYLQKPFDIPVKSDADLPTSVDWRQKGVVTPVKDQGQCGSCWTFATTETVESYVGIGAKYSALPLLSEQEIVSCVPNPKQCGGVGGCGGGIPEIAYTWIHENGGMTESQLYGYTSYWGDSGTCRFNNTRAPGATPAIAQLDGYVKLPTNNYAAVMSTLASHGVLAVNVAAAAWQDYAEGVYDGCTTDSTTIDHVVQLVGYGTDPAGGPYWLVRNSWSPAWGEGGYIRIQRHTEGNFCGVDKLPLDGTGCAGGPSQVTVCGSCGMIYDTSYPTGATLLEQP